MHYKAEVQADSSSERWNGNGLVFATYEEAESYVKDLEHRWTLVRATRVVTTDAPVNMVWPPDGKLRGPQP